MRIVCISDTHNFASRIDIPDGDVLVHAGDFTQGGHKTEFIAFSNWLSKQTHKHIIVIAGNHDWFAEESPEETRQLLCGSRDNVHYLHDQSVIIDGVKFFGSPYQPEFYSWAFNLKRGPEIAAKWQEIPDDVDVLITHGPPVNIGDVVHRDGSLALENVGCKDLSRRIEKLSKLKMHVYGHIHEGYGHRVINGINYVNASVLDERYAVANAPIVIDV